MTKGSYKLWCDYHLGRINRELTSEEVDEIEASEFAMHLLVPTSAVETISKNNGGLANLIKDVDTIESYAKLFNVEKEVFYFKIKYLLNEYEPNFIKESVARLSLIDRIKRIFKRR